MKAELKLAVVASALVVGLGCSQPAPQPGAAPDAGAAPAPAGSGGPAAAASAPVAAKPPAPTMMEMEVAAGTPLEITLDTPVASNTSKVEDTVRGNVTKAVVVGGMTVIPAGAPIKGNVVAVAESATVKGRASVAIRFNEVMVAKTPYKLLTTQIVREAAATKGKDAKKIGIGAGVGTAIGAIAGGGKGAAIGAGVGAAAGTGVVMATKGDEVEIPAGTALKTTIEAAVRINAPM
ncbi:MAG: hypothetical protein ND807_14035 [Vicinamibacterales bacterium]|nr:hypothetical protein [Vicinamibacterales bacterium]